MRTCVAEKKSESGAVCEVRPDAGPDLLRSQGKGVKMNAKVISGKELLFLVKQNYLVLIK